MIIKPSGDKNLIVKFKNEISKDVHIKVMKLCQHLKSKALPGIMYFYPSYNSVIIEYDPITIGFKKLSNYISSITFSSEYENDSIKIMRIPVCYEGEFAPDINVVAKHNSLSVKEVIKRHTEKKYLIYMLGFKPGFPYLGGLNPTIATPRLKTPRIKISAGSVGIADNQTGIYTVDSPGGWQIIGRTPMRLFDYNNAPPAVLSAGQYIEFYPISLKEYKEWGK